MKKKLVTWLLCACLSVPGGIRTNAEETAGVPDAVGVESVIKADSFGDFSYSVNDDGTTVTITGYTGEGGDVTIPETIDGKSVSSIGRSAFYDCSSNLIIYGTSGSYAQTYAKVNDITFVAKIMSGSATYTLTVTRENESVTFTKALEKKTKVTIPKTVKDKNGTSYKVTAVAANTFKNNKKVTSVIVGNNVKTIEKSAFAGCTKLKTVTPGTGVRPSAKRPLRVTRI